MKRSMALFLAAVLIAGFLASCARGKAEWHPDRDGSGAWYDASSKRIAALRRSANGDGLFELMRFSLDPAEGRISYLSFAAQGPDAYSCPDDASLSLRIDGPALRFSGTYEDGSAFEEGYRAVNKVFLVKKAAEAETRRKALVAKKEPSLSDQQETWVLEMIVRTLSDIELPR